MPFALYVTPLDGDVVNLHDGNPFWLESLEGASSAQVTRLGQRGPLQSGLTDLGYRISARVLSINLLFYATDDATLDSYRDTLANAFNFLGSTPLTLGFVRDDGTARMLRCYPAESIAIDLVPEHRPGHLHRATVTLRAATPFWLGSTSQGTVDYTDLTEWWLAGGAIDATDVLDHQENVGTTTTYTGASVSPSFNWGIVALVAEPSIGAADRYLWDDNGGSAAFYQRAGSARYSAIGTTSFISWPGTSGYNAHVFTGIAAQRWRYWNGSGLTTAQSSAGLGLTGTVSYRRQYGGGTATHWPDPVPRIAIIRDLSGFTPNFTAKIDALVPYVLNRPTKSVAAVNEGDTPAYPTISLQGPLVDPVITNSTTGAEIDLTGLTIAAGESITVNLQGGNKTITDTTGNSLLGSATALPIGIADFYLAPAPIAAGGTNTISVSVGSAGTVANIVIQHTNQYMSF